MPMLFTDGESPLSFRDAGIPNIIRKRITLSAWNPSCGLWFPVATVDPISKISLSETSLDCANVYRSQEPSIPDYATWPLQLAGTSSDKKDHAVPVVLQRDFGMECECDARRDVAERRIENEEKISEDGG
ncbi:ATPase get3 [Striga asiatica]|uniref:ATPase get3 n=1 Tax=Striga asiatica TaxID=4170 RepID=A0A5A7QUX9_STRAF|nr:ATPase get3 [Striga asiatica]